MGRVLSPFPIPVWCSWEVAVGGDRTLTVLRIAAEAALCGRVEQGRTVSSLAGPWAHWKVGAVKIVC